MKKPLICISTNSNMEKERSFNISSAYTDAIANAGGIPIVTAECCAEELADLCDGLLLSGGPDLDPVRYGETIVNDTVTIDAPRDVFEIQLAQEFLKRGKPILTICRGFQLLNVVMGGDLWQDLPSQLGFIHSHRDLRHPLFTEPGSVLHALYGENFRVNSTHHQAVRKIAPGLKVTAYSTERIIEAYEGIDLPIWGTQFHPERLAGSWGDARTPDMDKWFAHFIKQCQ